MWGHRVTRFELAGYLANVAGPVVLDLRIAHERFGSSSDPNLNGHLHYPHDIDRSLNEAVTDKIRKYRTDCNKTPPTVISFMSTIVSTSRRKHSEFMCLLFLQDHRETARFFVPSRVHLRYLEGRTSPRIVTGNQLSKVYVDTAHCTVNTFIHKHPKSPHCPLIVVKSFWKFSFPRTF
jgi:hypothetical protein